MTTTQTVQTVTPDQSSPLASAASILADVVECTAAHQEETVDRLHARETTADHEAYLAAERAGEQAAQLTDAANAIAAEAEQEAPDSTAAQRAREAAERARFAMIRVRNVAVGIALLAADANATRRADYEEAAIRAIDDADLREHQSRTEAETSGHAKRAAEYADLVERAADTDIADRDAKRARFAAQIAAVAAKDAGTALARAYAQTAAGHAARAEGAAERLGNALRTTLDHREDVAADTLASIKPDGAGECPLLNIGTATAPPTSPRTASAACSASP